MNYDDIRKQIDDAVSPMLATAMTHKAIFDAYVTAGFNRWQAFHLLLDDRAAARRMENS
jgi:hypothetical protein